MHIPPKGKVLVVDDDHAIRLVIGGVLEAQGHQVTLVENGHEALIVARLRWPDLIISDLVMPQMDGFELLERLKSDLATARIPVIALTALSDRAARIRALEAGAEDFVIKPIDEIELVLRVGNLLRLADHAHSADDAARQLARELRHTVDALRASNLETIFTMCRAMEYKEPNTGQHLRRISLYAQVCGQALGLDAPTLDTLTHATPMHDIGKIAVPDAILCKPGTLDREEWAVMRTHCERGAQLLAGGTSPYLVAGAEIALTHHENWDGSGYPQGLRGEAIPLSARIMAICDRYDALRARRPYKQPFSHAEAHRILLQGDQRSHPEHLDPQMLAIFVGCAARFEEIFDTYQQADPSQTPQP